MRGNIFFQREEKTVAKGKESILHIDKIWHYSAFWRILYLLPPPPKFSFSNLCPHPQIVKLKIFRSINLWICNLHCFALVSLLEYLHINKKNFYFLPRRNSKFKYLKQFKYSSHLLLFTNFIFFLQNNRKTS